MVGSTHALVGLTTLTAVQIISTQMGHPLVQPHMAAEGIPTGFVLCAGAAILGALLPDLDAEDSSILRDLGKWGWFVKLGMKLLNIKHRGVLHSGLAVVLVAVIAEVIGRAIGFGDVGLAFGLGYLSHVVLADAMTIAGVPLLWPSSYRFHLLPRFLRIQTGGMVERLVAGVVVVILFLLLPEAVPGELLKVFKI